MDDTVKFRVNPDVTENIIYMAQHARTLCKCARPKNEIMQMLPYDITDPILASVHFVERFQSDLLVSLHAILRDIGKQDHAIYVIALRSDGVDHNAYFNNRVREWYQNSNYTALSEYYRKIFIIEYYPEEQDGVLTGDLAISLKDATHTHPYSDQATYRSPNGEPFDMNSKGGASPWW